MEVDTVRISKKFLLQLLNAEVMVTMLEAGGVDNWEWAGEALNPSYPPGASSYRDEVESNERFVASLTGDSIVGVSR